MPARLNDSAGRPGRRWVSVDGSEGLTLTSNRRSQLAIKHTYPAHASFSDSWVSWVHASDAQRLEQGFRRIAAAAKLPGRQNSQVNIFELVHIWLLHNKHRSLLILDNLDDAKFLYATHLHDPPLVEHLPHCEKGSILITTRENQVACRFVESRHSIEVNARADFRSLELLETKLEFPRNGELVEQLAAALEHVLRAITQAAAFINKSLTCSIADYLDRLHHFAPETEHHLERQEPQVRRDRAAQNAIFLTWRVSFDLIGSRRAAAADLLSLMSFYESSHIPGVILRDRCTRAEPGDVMTCFGTKSCGNTRYGAIEANPDFEVSIQVLRDYCPISVTADDEVSFCMHALVQSATRSWLNEQSSSEFGYWKSNAIFNLLSPFQRTTGVKTF